MAQARRASDECAFMLLGKMIAMNLSQEVGFLGGSVFPILFIGGTAGALVHAIFPDIPAPLSIAAMIAALPGATISAPVSFILIGVGGVALGVSAIAPVGIAVISVDVITNHLNKSLRDQAELIEHLKGAMQLHEVAEQKRRAAESRLRDSEQRDQP